MALISLPDADDIELKSIRPDVPDQLNRSIWSRRGKVVGLPGAEAWRLSALVGPFTTEIEERPWRAFLHGLRGRQNHFHMPVACQRHYGPKPLVKAASAAGYTLPLDGMAASTRILSAGQYLTVPLPSGHKRLVMLMADLITNSSGEATAQLNLALGEIPADNAEVETGEPYVPVICTDGNPELSYDQGVSSAALTLEETML